MHMQLRRTRTLVVFPQIVGLPPTCTVVILSSWCRHSVVIPRSGMSLQCVFEPCGGGSLSKVFWASFHHIITTANCLSFSEACGNSLRWSSLLFLAKFLHTSALSDSILLGHSRFTGSYFVYSCQLMLTQGWLLSVPR